MRADRLLSLLMMLQIKGRATAQELAGRLEVSERTIYRDIEALSIAGVPNLEQYWAGWSRDFLTSLSRYPVKVRVSPLFLSILPQVLGETIHSRIEEAGPPDAEGWLTLPLMFETLEHARSYILGFGTMVEVLEPLELRTNIKQLAAGIVEFYKERERP